MQIDAIITDSSENYDKQNDIILTGKKFLS